MRPRLALFIVTFSLGFATACGNNQPGSTGSVAAKNPPVVEQSPPAKVGPTEPGSDTPRVTPRMHSPGYLNLIASMRMAVS